MKLSVLFYLFLLLSQSALAVSDFREYRPEYIDLETKLNYFQATGNYEPTGNTFDDLQNGGSYELYDFDLGVRSALNTRWALYGSGRVSQAESKDTLQTRSNSSFSQAVLGTDFLLFKGRFSLIPDFSITMPAKNIDQTSDTVMNNEGAIQAMGRIIARFDFSFLKTSSHLGATYRDGGRSHLLNYGIMGEVPIGRFAAGAGVTGTSSITFDDKTSDANSKEAIGKRVNGGSLKFYSVNPSLLDSQYWLAYNAKRWSAELGFGMTLAGASTAAGWNAFMGFTYRFQPSVTPPDAHKTEVEKFYEQTDDGVDQRLFEAPKPTPAPAPTPKAVVPKRKLIKQQLNDAEMQIELKNVKKKRRK